MKIPRRFATRRLGWLLVLIVGLWLCDGVLCRMMAPALQERPGSAVVLDQRGEELAVLPDRDGERCLPRPVAELGWVPACVIAGEDARFAVHDGVDVWRLLRATGQLLGRGAVVSGGSTLAMQTARLQRPHQRRLSGKIWELWAARGLTSRHGRASVLAAYCNGAPWGGRERGAEAAARRCFGRPAAHLSVGEAATLAALLPSPSRLRQSAAAGELRNRRDRILRRLHGLGQLDDTTLAAALGEAVCLRPQPWDEAAAWRWGELAEGRHGPIATAVDPWWQQRVEAAVATRPEGIDLAALIVLRRDDGRVVACAGADPVGLDATRVRRQPASTVKPFMYRAALAHGWAAAQPLADDGGAVAGLQVGNADHRYLGALPFDEALRRSRNPPALLAAASVPDLAHTLAEAGLRYRASAGLGAALGSVEDSPRRVAAAYQQLAAAADAGDRTASAVLAALQGHELRDDGGPRGRIAWKTGTSAGRRDAWCVAITPEHILCIWLGRRDGRPHPALTGSGPARELCARLALR